MAVSEVDIANTALGWLGEDSITDLSDDDDIYRNYHICRDACLEDVDWSFATRRYSLTSPAVPAPAFGYTNRFLLPSEILRVIEVNGNSYEWQLEERHILTDQDSCEVKAIARVTNPNSFSPNFVQLLSARLAATLAPSVTNSKGTAQLWWGIYGALKQAAEGNDGRQGTTRQLRQTSTRMRHTI